jgi:hypothetical protein
MRPANREIRPKIDVARAAWITADVGQEMRATWFTSMVAGFVFGAVAIASGPQYGALGTTAVAITFLVSVFVGVFGVPQMREMREEGRRRGLGIFAVMAERSDFSRFYIPTWGRMFVWFCAAGAGGFVLKTIVE